MRKNRTFCGYAASGCCANYAQAKRLTLKNLSNPHCFKRKNAYTRCKLLIEEVVMVQRITLAPQGPEFSRFVMGYWRLME